MDLEALKLKRDITSLFIDIEQACPTDEAFEIELLKRYRELTHAIEDEETRLWKERNDYV